MTNLEKLNKLIQEVLELSEKATPSPWKWYENRNVATLNGPLEDPRVEFASLDNSLVLDDGSAGGEYAPTLTPDEPNAQLIAHYRTSAPKFAKALQVAIKTLESYSKYASQVENTYGQYPCDKALVEIEKIMEEK